MTFTLDTALIQNEALTGLLITVVVMFVSWYYNKYRNVPPGPHGIPFIGYGPFLRQDPPQKLTELKKYYGKVMSVFLGPQLTIILNDYEAIKEAFVGQGYTFTGRPSTFMFNHISEKKWDGNPHGLVVIDGEDWKETRRFAISGLRDLGMGKNAIQIRILEEAEHLCSVFKDNIGKPFDSMDILQGSTCNVISQLCFGYRFDYKNPEIRAILKDLQDYAVLIAQSGPVQAFPLLRFLPGPFARAWADWVSTKKNIDQFVINQLEKVSKMRQDQSAAVMPSLTHLFFTEQERLNEHGNQPERSKLFRDLDIRLNIQGMFGGGTETSATSLNWALFFMLHYPDIQAKAHREIDEQVGRERSITVDDKVKLPFVEAIIRESQRRGNVVPFGLMRCNTEEVQLLGFRIPERSNVMANYKAVNMDPKLWKNPEEYRPERFINAKGQLEEPPYFMPFAIGKRSCMAEPLARMELFIFFANLMQRFEFRPVAGQQLPAIDDYITGISCRPQPFDLDIHPRV